MSHIKYDEFKDKVGIIVNSMIKRMEKLQKILEQDYTNILLKLKLEEMNRKISEYTEKFVILENTDLKNYSEKQILNIYNWYAHEITQIENNFDLFCSSYNI